MFDTDHKMDWYTDLDGLAKQVTNPHIDLVGDYQVYYEVSDYTGQQIAWEFLRRSPKYQAYFIYRTAYKLLSELQEDINSSLEDGYVPTEYEELLLRTRQSVIDGVREAHPNIQEYETLFPIDSALQNPTQSAEFDTPIFSKSVANLYATVKEVPLSGDNKKPGRPPKAVQLDPKGAILKTEWDGKDSTTSIVFKPSRGQLTYFSSETHKPSEGMMFALDRDNDDRATKRASRQFPDWMKGERLNDKSRQLREDIQKQLFILDHITLGTQRKSVMAGIFSKDAKFTQDEVETFKSLKKTALNRRDKTWTEFLKGDLYNTEYD